jgi:hypothetical protein
VLIPGGLRGGDLVSAEKKEVRLRRAGEAAVTHIHEIKIPYE